MSGIRSRFDPSSFVNTAKATAEDEGRFELRCVACGYGAAVRVAPEACLMRRAIVWEYVRSGSTEEVST
jgi:hypothetical protein